MKASELRIGNYVDYFSEGIDRWLNARQVTANDIACIDLGTADHADPITLTEEWLIEFGAVKNEVGEHGDEGHVIYYELEKLTVCDWGNGLIMSNAFAHGIRVPLQFVHQLQNLYFALTGEELIGH